MAPDRHVLNRKGGRNGVSCPKQMHLLILTWADEDQNSSTEIIGLQEVLTKGYSCKTTEKLAIPTTKYAEAMVKTLLDAWLDDRDDGKSLLVVYYSGHGTMNKFGNLVWGAMAFGGPELEWRNIQESIGRCTSDILFVFDCCCAASAMNSINYSGDDADLRIEKPGKQVYCALCSDSPNDLQKTTCGHIFCKDCIAAFVAQPALCDPLNLTCPECSQAFHTLSAVPQSKFKYNCRFQKEESVGVVELIAACGFDSSTPAPGKFSFTNALTASLQKLSSNNQQAPVSILTVLRYTTRMLHENSKIKKGESTTPIFLRLAGDADQPSISLNPTKPVQKILKPHKPSPEVPQVRAPLPQPERIDLLDSDEEDFMDIYNS